MGPFRVIVTGVRGFTDYARLRDTLDRLLRNRLPGVVILSRCGRGTDALATSYAVDRGLPLVPYPLDLERDRTDELAADRRNARLVADADAAVVVWDRLDRDLGELLGRCKRKGIPLRVLVRGRSGDIGPGHDQAEGSPARPGGLPD